MPFYINSYNFNDEFYLSYKLSSNMLFIYYQFNKKTPLAFMMNPFLMIHNEHQLCNHPITVD